jgi:hypothetical protein
MLEVHQKLRVLFQGKNITSSLTVPNSGSRALK